MKLTEIIISIVIFLIVTVVCLESYTNVLSKTDSIKRLIGATDVVLKNDALIRKEIKSVDLCYWKNFDNEVKDDLARLQFLHLKGSARVASVRTIYDKKINEYGIRVEWNFDGKEYVTQEYIKPGFINVQK